MPVATKTIVNSFEVTEKGTDFLTLQWKANENYSEFYWKVGAACSLKCGPFNFDTVQRCLPSNHREITFSSLKPGNICYLDLRAQFINFPTADDGLDLVAETHSCSK